jgi:hypothetical protein
MNEISLPDFCNDFSEAGILAPRESSRAFGRGSGCPPAGEVGAGSPPQEDADAQARPNILTGTKVAQERSRVNAPDLHDLAKRAKM